MSRITFEGLFCDIAQCVGQPGNTSECAGGYCDQRRTWERLKEYEDTGLEPEQILRWISVTDRLPETNKAVIVCRKDGRVEQGIFRGVNGWWKVYGTNTKSITHWMPMPEPPEEVAK